MRVLIDRECPYCRAFGRSLKALDLRRSLEVRPLQEVEGMDREALLQELHVLEGAKVHRGYGALLRLARGLALLWPLYPLLFLGQALGLGPRLYRAFARRRPRA